MKQKARKLNSDLGDALDSLEAKMPHAASGKAATPAPDSRLLRAGAVDAGWPAWALKDLAAQGYDSIAVVRLSAGYIEILTVGDGHVDDMGQAD